MKLKKNELLDCGSMARAIEKMGEAMRGMFDGNDVGYLINDQTFSEQIPELIIHDGELYMRLSLHYYDHEEHESGEALDVKWKLSDILKGSLYDFDEAYSDKLTGMVKAFPDSK